MGDQKYHEEINKFSIEGVKTVFTALILIILAMAVLMAVILFFEHFRTQQITNLCLEQAYALKEGCQEFIINKGGNVFS